MNTKAMIAIVGAFVGLLAVIVLSPFTIVNAGDRAVVLNVGSVNRVLSSGMHWITPLIESVHKFDVRTQKEQADAESASSDLQMVHTTIALNYNLDPEKVGDLYAKIGDEYKIRIIDPAIQEAVKAATAKYTAEELITKRASVKDDIKAALQARLTLSFINVDDVSIVNFDFSDSFKAAIEAKVTAEQNALAAKNKLEQVKYEADQRIAQAQGEAEAIKIQAQAITQQGGEDYVKLQAIKTWDGHGCVNNCFGANTQMPVPFLNLNK